MSNTKTDTTIKWVLFLSLAFYAAVLPAENITIRFAPLPMESNKVVHEQFQGFIDYLASETGYQIKVLYYSDYDEILSRFANNEIDLAYLGPLPYVVLKKKLPAAESIGCFREIDGSASYTCSLVSWEEGILNNGNLEHVKIGLTQPYSTCGYLAVSQMLKQHGHDLNDYKNNYSYAGTHAKAALGVVKGKYDIAGVKTAIAKKYAHLGLIIIQNSRAYPGFSLVANNNTLNADQLKKLTAALIRLGSNRSGDMDDLIKTWGKKLQRGTIPASECNYNTVIEELENIPWPIPGVY